MFLSLLTVLRVHRWAILGTEPWHPGPAGKILALISPQLLSGRATALWGISQGCQEKESKKGELRLHQQPGGFHVNLRGAEQRETGYRKWRKQWITPNTARCSLLLVRCGACFVGQLFLGRLSSCDSSRGHSYSPASAWWFLQGLEVLSHAVADDLGNGGFLLCYGSGQPR